MKKRRRDAQHEKQQMERLIRDGRDPYAGYHRQPDPFSTNAYWLLEDNPPQTSQSTKKKNARRRTNSREGEACENADTADSGARCPPNAHAEKTETSADDTSQSLPVPWNRLQNQRDDGEVWGFEYTTRPHRFRSLDAEARARAVEATTLDRAVSRHDHAGPVSLSQTTDASMASFPPLIQPPTDHSPTLASLDTRVTPQDLNDLIPPGTVFPEDNVLGNMWFRQPPPHADFMDNRTDSDSARSRTSTAATHSLQSSLQGPRDSMLRKELSRHLLSAQRSRTTLQIPGTASTISRSNTQRSSASRRTPQSFSNAPAEEIPNILDDEFVPWHERLRESSQAQPRELENSEDSEQTAITSSTVIHTPPPINSSGPEQHMSLGDDDGGSDADDDLDSGVDIDVESPMSSPGLSTEPTILGLAPTQSQLSDRSRPLRSITAPDTTPSLQSKSYMFAIPSATKRPIKHAPAKTKTTGRSRASKPHAVKRKSKKPLDQDSNDFWKDALASRHFQGRKTEEVEGLPEMVFDDEQDGWGGEGEDDVRWTWKRGRRWSADV